MNKLYYVDVKIFDTPEETPSLIRRAVIATDEDNASDIVAEQMEEEIKSVPWASYEILKVEFIREL
jgi:hypothetical protein